MRSRLETKAFPESITQNMAEFVSSVRYDQLGKRTIDAAKRCLIDTFGCILGGSVTPSVAPLVHSAEQWSGSGSASIFGVKSFDAHPYTAAFTNAGFANALDFDDTLIGHHGATVIPTVLALGEAYHVSGESLIEAIVVGYEVSIRCMGCLQPTFGRFTGGWDLGTLQTLGAAVAAAKLLNARNDQISSALGIALAAAPTPMVRKDRTLAGPRSPFKSGYPWSVQAGMQAAILAEQGFNAADRCLDGNVGHWTEQPCQRLGLDGLISNLGDEYLIERVGQKAYPACRFTHSALEALELILGRTKQTLDSLVSIRVRTFDLLTDTYHNIPRPASYTEGQFSLPFLLAMLLNFRQLTAHEMVIDHTGNADVLRLAALVRVERDPLATQAFPNKEIAVVKVRYAGGYEALERVDMPLGSDGRVQSEERIEEKFLNQAALAIGPSIAPRRLLNLLKEIEQCQDIREIAASLNQD